MTRNKGYYIALDGMQIVYFITYQEAVDYCNLHDIDIREIKER